MENAGIVYCDIKLNKLYRVMRGFPFDFDSREIESKLTVVSTGFSRRKRTATNSNNLGEMKKKLPAVL